MEKVCKQCSSPFEISETDLHFYERVSPVIGSRKFSIPPPTLCPYCREQRRMCFRNERNLYARKCSKTGATLISMFSPDKEFPVYANSEWWKDDFDARQYACDVDFDRPLFPQLCELQQKVPRMHTFTYAGDRQENSAYVNCSGDLKDCYLGFGTGRSQSCMYPDYLYDCENCVDCYFALKSTNCYECVDVESCHTLFWSQSSNTCHDSCYLYDCQGCSDSIACVGLRHKSYYYLNEPCDKEELKRIRSRLLASPEERLRVEEQYRQLVLRVSRKALQGDRNQNSIGDFLWNTKNCVHCFDTYNAEDCKYCAWFADGRDAMDYYAWGECELCYEVCGGGDQHYDCVFTNASFGCTSCYYTDFCVYCKHCFGCVGLKHCEYCVLNRQYSKTSYEDLTAKLIEQMMTTGEWGQFFPVHLSYLGYNESVAQEYYPLTEEQALKQGFAWSNYKPDTPSSERTIKASNLPHSINDAGDEFIGRPIACEVTGKPYKIIGPELHFYRKNGLPLPRRHPQERHRNRLSRRNPRHLWLRECARCHSEIYTTYAPERPETVYCEKCYLEVIY